MCAIEAGKRGRKVVVLDHANKPGKKILMSGGGRCNFTNYTIEAENYLSQNPHFCKSALSRYTQWDFLALVNDYAIPFHERDHGQLFCNDSAKDILNMLLAECHKYQVHIILDCKTGHIKKLDDAFVLQTNKGEFQGNALVVATGGLSIPKMSASPFGYQVAEQFGLHIIETRAGLVPVTWQDTDKPHFADLSGIAVLAMITFGGHQFRENVLFTHRGLSGPAILQISSYWTPGNPLEINLLPDVDVYEWLRHLREHGPDSKLKNLLADHLPKRLLSALLTEKQLNHTLKNCSDTLIKQVALQLNNWQIKPNGTEGYRTAEVTVGGVDCNALSSKTMESKQVKALYFIGEVVDVTGWLGGYNFQWAWSSGWCAGQFV